MHILSFVRQYLVMLAFTAIVVGGVFLNARFGCENVTVGGSATRRPGDGTTMIYEKRAARPDAYRHGESVLYLVARANDTERLLTGRVAGVAGDTVGIRAGKLVRNGEPIDGALAAGFDDLPEMLVPGGTIYVLGETPSSRDCRRYGPVPVEAVRGRIVNGDAPAE